MCTVYDEQYRLGLFTVCKICVYDWLLRYSHAYHANFCAQTACLRWVVQLLCLPLSVCFYNSVWICVLVCACTSQDIGCVDQDTCYISVSCFLNWQPYDEIQFICIYNYIALLIHHACALWIIYFFVIAGIWLLLIDISRFEKCYSEQFYDVYKIKFSYST